MTISWWSFYLYSPTPWHTVCDFASQPAIHTIPPPCHSHYNGGPWSSLSSLLECAKVCRIVQIIKTIRLLLLLGRGVDRHYTHWEVRTLPRGDGRLVILDRTGSNRYLSQDTVNDGPPASPLWSTLKITDICPRCAIKIWSPPPPTRKSPGPSLSVRHPATNAVKASDKLTLVLLLCPPLEKCKDTHYYQRHVHIIEAIRSGPFEGFPYKKDTLSVLARSSNWHVPGTENIKLYCTSLLGILRQTPEKNSNVLFLKLGV